MPEEPEIDSDSPEKPRKPVDLPGAEWPDPPKRPARSRLRSTLSPSTGSKKSGRGGRYAWRFIFYAVFVLYLAGDFFVFRGPLRQRYEKRQALGPTSAERAIEKGWVATVNGESISTDRLDRAVDIHLYQRGRKRDQQSTSGLRYIRGAVLQHLIDDLLVEQYTRGQKHQVHRDQIDSAVARFESQFKDAGQLQQRSAAQHLDARQRRQRLGELTAQVDWLEAHLASSPRVTETAARQWYDNNREGGPENGFGVAETYRARHIFLSTVSDDSPGREQQIHELHRQLTEDQADFAALAAEHSEDLRSKPRGGDLNWFTAARMPADFIAAVETLQPGELSEPFRSGIGWHIVEMTDRQPARDASFEEMREEIIAYLETEDRRQKIEEFVENLRRTSIVQVFPEQL